MDISITGKQLDIGDALRAYIETELGNTVSKYFPRALGCSVTICRESHLFRADASVHLIRSVNVQGRATAETAYAAFDAALERIAKQMRRYKRRLNDHHGRRTTDDTTLAPQYVIAPEHEDIELPVDGQPAIVAEVQTEIASLTVSEAVMRMDLSDVPVVMFRNRAHGELNVIYRRPDGNIGWIDPSGGRAK